MMNKRLLTISVVALSAATIFGVIGLTVNYQNIGLLAKENTNDYTITFNGSNVIADAYDSTNYVQPFSLHKDNAIQGKYDMDTYDFIPADTFGTYYFGDDIATFNNDGHIVEFTSQAWEEIYIIFDIINYAEVNLDKSVISYTVDGVYHNEKFDNYGGSDIHPGFNTHIACFDCYSYYGKEIVVTEVKLVFSCPK